MPLWGNKDFATGNNKPVYANTSNLVSNSTINAGKANTDKFYGSTFGVSATEEAALTTYPVQHAGWVSLKIGTGPIRNISVVNAGQGINAAGFLLLTDTSAKGSGATANISFTIANSQNTLQSSSSNAFLNAIATLTIVNGGTGWSNASQITVTTNGANITAPTFSITLGGRGGRRQSETLVAMGSITLDDPKDNVYFSGV
jgi:hypothetical protein